MAACTSGRVCRAIRAGRTAAMNSDIKALGAKPARQRQPTVGRQRNVIHTRALVAIKMAMFLHVRAKTGGAALDGHLAGQAAANQRIQAIINGGHRDFRHRTFGADKNFFGGRVIAFLQQHSIDMLALRRKTKTARCQPLGQTVVRPSFLDDTHLSRATLLPAGRHVNIWNNSKLAPQRGSRCR